MTSQRRSPQWIPWVTACSALALLTVLTPFTLAWSAPKDMEWERLSLISQTYAAVSIPLTGAALLGVVWSLALQTRQSRNDNEDRSRASMRELLLRSVEDDNLLVCWAPPASPMTREQYRQAAFINAIYNGWRTEYANGMIPDAVLYSTALRTMKGEIGRNHWKATRLLRQEEARGSASRRHLKFVQIMDQALEQAEAEGPPVSPKDYFLPDQISRP
ncbi:DUF6082 family protein [Streptomyces chartreusis]|uniref:DUF6082 family protein n=1 Tax=Streptomyces chartreusis TaxID=1969 RepID=UPI00343EFFEE